MIIIFLIHSGLHCRSCAYCHKVDALQMWTGNVHEYLHFSSKPDWISQGAASESSCGIVITDHRLILQRKLLQRSDSSSQRNPLVYSLRESRTHSKTPCLCLCLLLIHTCPSLLLALVGSVMSDQCLSCQQSCKQTFITLSKLISVCLCECCTCNREKGEEIKKGWEKERSERNFNFFLNPHPPILSSSSHDNGGEKMTKVLISILPF